MKTLKKSPEHNSVQANYKNSIEEFQKFCLTNGYKVVRVKKQLDDTLIYTVRDDNESLKKVMLVMSAEAIKNTFLQQDYILNLDHEYLDSASYFTRLSRETAIVEFSQDGVSLIDFLNELPTEEKSVSFLGEALKLLIFLHEKNIVFMNLTVDNIYVKGEKPLVKNVYFAQSRRFKTNRILEAPKAINRLVPELIRGQKATFETDMFTFGLLVTRMISPRSYRQFTKGSYIKEVRERTFAPIFTCAAPIQDVLYKLLDLNPQKRPSALEVSQHPVFKNYFSE